MRPTFFNNSNKNSSSNSSNQQQRNTKGPRGSATPATPSHETRNGLNIAGLVHVINAAENNNANLANKSIPQTNAYTPSVNHMNSHPVNTYTPPINSANTYSANPYAPPINSANTYSAQPYAPPVNSANTYSANPYAPPVNSANTYSATYYSPPVNYINPYSANTYTPPVNSMNSYQANHNAPAVNHMNSYPAHTYAPPANNLHSLPANPSINSANSNTVINNTHNNNSKFDRWCKEKRDKKLINPVNDHGNARINLQNELQRKFALGSVNFYEDLLTKDKKCQEMIVRKPKEAFLNSEVNNLLSKELGWNDWQFFIAKGAHESAINALIKDDSLLFAKDQLGRTALHIAIEWKQEAIFNWLLLFGDTNVKSGKGKLLDIRDCLGRSPLHIAAQTNTISIANALLKAGAILDCMDRKGNTPVAIAILNSSEIMADLLSFGQLSEPINTHVAAIIPTPTPLPKATLAMITCSITGDIMRDPVTLLTGQTYEREAIETWLRSHDTCPLTGQILHGKHTLIPAYSIKSFIAQSQEEGLLREYGLFPSSENARPFSLN